ncbi:hypothetical protein E3N88_43076 [Mikania micrantha]|uniref:Uncharacterized protein n=1 Tax=Mikania micrantha TaxID=192012 RepID=A0A5N6LGS6_9ASTR|nr:hypothetical protein E3N88_43076 [Mikania micrantha]
MHSPSFTRNQAVTQAKAGTPPLPLAASVRNAQRLPLTVPVTPRAGGLERLSHRAEGSRGAISFDNQSDQIVYIAHEPTVAVSEWLWPNQEGLRMCSLNKSALAECGHGANEARFQPNGFVANGDVHAELLEMQLKLMIDLFAFVNWKLLLESVGIRAFGFQMARREGQYFPVCRIADGGNNSGVFHSRAREEDQSSTYRIADRGSGEVGLDPQDLKINQISPTWKETEPEEPYDDEEVNKEDCRWNAKALNEVDSQVRQPLWGSDETMGDELVSKICNVENIEGSDPKVVIGGPTAQSQSKVIPSFMPKDTPELLVRPRFTDFQKEDNLIKSPTLEDTQKESDIQLEENILISRNTDQFADNYTFSLEGLDVDLYVGADGSIKFLKQFNNYAHKTRGRVFFEDGENDAGDDPRNNPDPE